MNSWMDLWIPQVFALILVATIIVAVQAQQYSSAEKPYRASPKQKYVS